MRGSVLGNISSFCYAPQPLLTDVLRIYPLTHLTTGGAASAGSGATQQSPLGSLADAFARQKQTERRGPGHQNE